MIGLDLGSTEMALLTAAIIGGMMVFFIRETYPPEVTALAGASIMLILGILPQKQALDVLSNSAPWTIASMFIIVGALVRTGTLDSLGRAASRHAATRPKMTLILLALTVVGLSAFMNNTPLVVVMIPIFMQLAREINVAPSKLLIPLSYFSIMGGTITMIGTSTNLIVDGVAVKNGLKHFGIFEIAPVGLTLAITGLVYIGLFGNRLLPVRDSMSNLLGGGRSRMKFFTEVVVPEDSALIGEPLNEVDIFKRDTARVIDVLRGDLSLRRNLDSVTLEAGDRIVLRTPMSEVLGLQSHKELRMIDKIGSVETETVEVLITPGCHMVGRSLGSMRLRRRYGVYVLAAHRRNQNIGRQLDDLVVRVGDTLLLEGASADIQRLSLDMEMVEVTQPSDRAYRRNKAPIAMAVLMAVVLLSGFDVAPIVFLAMIGVAVVLLTRCIDADEALGYVEGRLLLLVFAMLAVGAGLDNSGAVSMFVERLAPYLMQVPPWGIILAVYALASILTEIVTNNAVAVIITPVAIALAQHLGLDPRPLVVAVMMGASASFATPIGYQTNTLVYGPGGYRFTDYLWIGLPLNIMMGLASALVIPFFWPLIPG